MEPGKSEPELRSSNRDCSEPGDIGITEALPTTLACVVGVEEAASMDNMETLPAIFCGWGGPEVGVRLPESTGNTVGPVVYDCHGGAVGVRAPDSKGKTEMLLAVRDAIVGVREPVSTPKVTLPAHETGGPGVGVQEPVSI
mmetsp:Transcript_99165/g.285209  ORF Transcript_99165/g.285209 Transcript_99165/m.285209 type:complete len:141 (+) Transcript_99165:1128-1550(+)